MEKRKHLNKKHENRNFFVLDVTGCALPTMDCKISIFGKKSDIWTVSPRVHAIGWKILVNQNDLFKTKDFLLG